MLRRDTDLRLCLFFSALIKLARLKYNEKGWGILMTATITASLPPSLPPINGTVSFSAILHKRDNSVENLSRGCSMSFEQFSAVNSSFPAAQVRLVFSRCQMLFFRIPINSNVSFKSIFKTICSRITHATKCFPHFPHGFWATGGEGANPGFHLTSWWHSLQYTESLEGHKVTQKLLGSRFFLCSVCLLVLLGASR